MDSSKTRTKRSAGSKPLNIKEVIETLSHILSLHGYSKISPDIFRQAKYNKPEATPFLLCLLHEILQKETEIRIGYLQDVLVYVLHKLDYPHLYKFVNCSETEFSSQDILLIFGFLLVKLNLMHSLRKKVKRMLVDSLVVLTPETVCYEQIQTLKNKDFNAVIVLQKKIDFAMRGLRSSILKYENLVQRAACCNNSIILKELNSNESNKMFSSISLCEFLLQGNLKLQKELVGMLSKQNMLLKLHLKWIKYETVFWRWMSSVASGQTQTVNTSFEQLTSSQRLKHALLVSESDKFIELFGAILGDQRRNKIESAGDALVIKEDFSIMRHAIAEIIMAKLVASDGKGTAEKYVGTLENLVMEIKKMQENNRLWLSDLLHKEYPNLVCLPVPRR
ncbi:tubulin epsilon and delta complex protein 1-like [Hydractinia symbiolongicarpus]|uniref:tubulin epsilon and delta complex protein 1-like n=1 Tax=Hydractinia symbiolongicarpus TaxID=13093 RepID=UPI00254D95E6|nr:tubulin epsilon and delta complex protein 1-like [Hydractinia symbiolongicarpus]